MTTTSPVVHRLTTQSQQFVLGCIEAAKKKQGEMATKNEGKRLKMSKDICIVTGCQGKPLST